MLQTGALRPPFLLNVFFLSQPIVEYLGGSFGSHSSDTLAHQPLIPSTKPMLLLSEVRFEEVLENKSGVIQSGRLSQHALQRWVSAAKAME